MSKKIKKQIEIEINGESANAGLRDLGKYASQLRQQLWGMKDNAEGFAEKSLLLEEVRERYRDLKDEADGIARKHAKIAEEGKEVGASYDKVKVYMEQLDKEVKSLNRSSAEYIEKSEELKRVKKQFADIKDEVDGLKQKQIEIAEAGKKMGASYNEVKAYVEQLDDQVKNMNRSSAEYIEKSEELQRVRKQFEGIKDEVEGLKQKQIEIAEAAQKAGASYDSVKTYVEQLDKEVKQLNRDSDTYIKKSEELARVKKQFKGIKDEMNGVQQKQAEIAKAGKKATASYEELGEYAEQLNDELKKMPRNAALFAKKAEELKAVKKNYAEIGQKINGTTKANTKATGGIGKLGSMAKMASGPLLALFSAQKIIEFGQHVASVANQVIGLRLEVGHAFKAQGNELDALTVQIQATGNALDIEKNTIIEAGKAIKTQWGGDMLKNLDKVQQALSGVSKTQKDEIIGQMDEYAAKAKDAGMSLDQMLGYLVETSNMGITSDKAMDAAGEGMISLREMTKGTADALKGLGINAIQMEEDILSGSKTYFQALQEISKATNKIPKESKQMGTVLADVFRGAGEDGGAILIRSLHTMGKGLDAATNKSSKLYQENQRRLALEKEVAKAQNDIAKELEEGAKAANTFKKELQVIAYKVSIKLIQGFKTFMAFVKPGFAKLKKGVQALVKAMGGWKDVWNTITTAYKTAFAIIVAPLKAIYNLASAIAKKFGGWKEVIRKIGTVFKVQFGTISKVAKTISKAFEGVTKIIGGIAKMDWSGTWKKIEAGWAGLGRSILSIGRGIQEGIGDFFNTEKAQKRHAEETKKREDKEARERGNKRLIKMRDDLIAESKLAVEADKKAAQDAKDKEARKGQVAEARRLRWLENLKQHFQNLHTSNGLWQAEELTQLKEKLHKGEITQSEHDKKVHQIRKEWHDQNVKLLKSEHGKSHIAYQNAYSGRLDLIIARGKQIEAAKKKAHAESLKNIDEVLTNELVALKAGLVSLRLEEEDYHIKVYVAKRAALKKKLALTAKQHGIESLQYKKLYGRLLSLQQSESKRQAAVAKKKFQGIQKAANEAYKEDLAGLKKKLDKHEISEKEYYRQAEKLLSAHWAKKLSVARAMYGTDSKEYKDFLKKKNKAEEALDTEAGNAKRGRLEKLFSDMHEITSEGGDLAIEIINHSTEKKLAALEAEAEKIAEFWEGEKEAEQEKYDEEQEIEQERYDLEKEVRDERWEEENEAIAANYDRLKEGEKGRHGIIKDSQKEQYEEKRDALKAELKQLKKAGKEHTQEYKDKEQAILDLKKSYGKQVKTEDTAHKASLKKIDEQEKAEKKARDKAHKAEQKKRDDEFKAGQKRAEELHTQLLNKLNKDQTAEEKAAKDESLKIKKEAHEKSKLFTIAQIITQLGVEVAGYFAHPGSIATFGVLGAAKMAFAAGRAGFQIAKVSSQQFGNGGFLQSAKMMSEGGRLYAGNDGGMIVRGATHQEGGIQLFDVSTGKFLKENIEGDEAIVSSKRTASNPKTVNALISGTENLDKLLFAAKTPRVDQEPIRRFAVGGYLGGSATGTATTNQAGAGEEQTTEEAGNNNEVLEAVAGALTTLVEAIEKLNSTQEELSGKIDHIEAKIAIDHFQDIQSEVEKLEAQTKV